MELAPDESVYSDDRGLGSHSLRTAPEDGRAFDAMEAFRADEDEVI
jgi:hypothetical protein